MKRKLPSSVKRRNEEGLSSRTGSVVRVEKRAGNFFRFPNGRSLNLACEQRTLPTENSRPLVKSDTTVRNFPANFFKKMPRSTIQSNYRYHPTDEVSRRPTADVDRTHFRLADDIKVYTEAKLKHEYKKEVLDIF